MRPWRSVPRAVPAASQLRLLATPECIRFISPHGRRPDWIFWTAQAVAFIIIKFGFGAYVYTLATQQDLSEDSRSPMLGLAWFGAACFFAGWIALSATLASIGAWHSWWTWFELEVTRDRWSASLTRPRRGGCSWERSSDSGPTAELRGAKVGSHALLALKVLCPFCGRIMCAPRNACVHCLREVCTPGPQVATEVAAGGYHCALELVTTGAPCGALLHTATTTSFSFTLTDLEFVAAEINRFLEAQGHEVPASLDAGAVADCAAPVEDGPLAASQYAGGAPLARPAALVPAMPPAWCGLSVHCSGSAVEVTLPHPSPDDAVACSRGAAAVAATLAILGVATIFAYLCEPTHAAAVLLKVCLSYSAVFACGSYYVGVNHARSCPDTLCVSSSGWKLRTGDSSCNAAQGTFLVRPIFAA